MREADEEQSERRADRRVDAVLDGREHRDEDSGEPDHELQRRHAPERVHLARTRDEIGDSMNDDGRQTGARDPEESWSEAVQSDDDDDGGQDARSRGPHSRLRFQCRTGERASGRVCAEDGADRVSDADGDELLVRVDLVSIQTAKGCIVMSVAIPNRSTEESTHTLRSRYAREAR